MGVILALILQLLKLCVIGFVVAFQGSQGFVISPSPKTIHVNPSPSEAPGFIHPKEPWRTIAPSLQEVPNGPFFLPPPKSAPTPEKTRDSEPSISPSPGASTITSTSPPYNGALGPSTAEGNVSPSIQLSPPQSKTPAFSPPVFTPIAPAPIAVPSGNLTKTSPVSQPTERGSSPPKTDERNKSHKPEPAFPAVVPIPSTQLPKYSPVSQPNENGSLPHRDGANNGHVPEPISPGM